MLVKNPLHILCFGNSITAGYINGRYLDFHPYGWKLQDVLQKALPSAVVTTDLQGNPGDQVTSPPGGYLPRIDTLFGETKTPYNWSIILGGTNDLAVGRQPDDVWEALLKVYEYPLGNNSKVLALTVPDSDWSPEPAGRRDRLNELIRNHTAENFYVYDLFKTFPYRGLSDKKRNELWSDGIHPSEHGYDVMGDLLAKELFRLITGKVLVEEEEWREELRRRNAIVDPDMEKRAAKRQNLRRRRVVPSVV